MKALSPKHFVCIIFQGNIIFGKSSSSITNTIISQDEFNNDDILKNVDRRCKSFQSVDKVKIFVNNLKDNLNN